jgi:acyl carrier protein
MPDTDSSIADALVAFLQDQAAWDAARCDTTTPLFSSGLLDSFTLFALLAFVEEHFGVSVAPQDLAHETVDSVVVFSRYIASHRR